jgi:RimJ/RimL family protein N-acetyltransferase
MFSVDPAPRPQRIRLEGRYSSLEPLDPAHHGEGIWIAGGGEAHADLWQWMPDGPYPDRAGFDLSLAAKAASEDPLYFAIVDNQSGEAWGHASYLRIEQKHRVIEVGSIYYGTALQRSRQGTEAMYLMMRHAFDGLGYRRYEWKCNALNEPSRRAALRYGFQFEGIFRQHMIIKGRNRDTAWFSLLDSEWPAVKENFERWLDPSNFDAEGRQLTPLRKS